MSNISKTTRSHRSHRSLHWYLMPYLFLMLEESNNAHYDFSIDSCPLSLTSDWWQSLFPTNAQQWLPSNPQIFTTGLHLYSPPTYFKSVASFSLRGVMDMKFAGIVRDQNVNQRWCERKKKQMVRRREIVIGRITEERKQQWWEKFRFCEYQFFYYFNYLNYKKIIINLKLI